MSDVDDIGILPFLDEVFAMTADDLSATLVLCRDRTVRRFASLDECLSADNIRSRDIVLPGFPFLTYCLTAQDFTRLRLDDGDPRFAKMMTSPDVRLRPYRLKAIWSRLLKRAVPGDTPRRKRVSRKEIAYVKP